MNDPLHPNISMHILNNILYTFPKVLTRRTSTQYLFLPYIGHSYLHKLWKLFGHYNWILNICLSTLKQQIHLQALVIVKKD